ncbi:SU10 major capsid protein [Saccharothrix carnea]|uniref:SU10 major capsid protein n=1 Tax=Saccharothrix TaxID=2071 RepID=UPI003629E8D6
MASVPLVPIVNRPRGRRGHAYDRRPSRRGRAAVQRGPAAAAPRIPLCARLLRRADSDIEPLAQPRTTHLDPPAEDTGQDSEPDYRALYEETRTKLACAETKARGNREKARRLDETEAANKTDAEKAAERATAAEAQSHPAPLAEALIIDLMQKVWENGGMQISETATLMCNAWQKKRMLTHEFVTKKNYCEESRNVGGAAVSTIETGVGGVNSRLNRWTSTVTVQVVCLDQCPRCCWRSPGRGSCSATAGQDRQHGQGADLRRDLVGVRAGDRLRRDPQLHHRSCSRRGWSWSSSARSTRSWSWPTAACGSPTARPR